METFKPAWLAYAKIRVLEVDSMSGAEQKYCMSLAKTNKKVVAFTTLCDVSTRMVPDTIREYIEKEKLVDATLQCLDLGQNRNMSCESLGKIVELLSGYHIQAVDLAWNPQLDDSMVAAIQPLLVEKKSHLTDLKLARCGLTVAGLKSLVKVASKSKLRLLDISHMSISGESELIEQMLELPMIEELALRSCDLSPEDVRTVAEGLPFTSVKALILSGNAFGSQGLVHLASTLSESMVELLDVSGVGIEAECEGLSQLAAAWAKRPFPKLYLRNNPMGYAEVMSFIKVLQSLKSNGSEDATWMGNVSRRCC